MNRASDRPELGDAVAAALLSSALEVGVSLAANQVRQMLDYVRMLERWGRAFNLSGAKDASQLLREHVVDCLTVVAPLEHWATAHAGSIRILDVGSGAGLPGLVLAIARPEWSVTTVDAAAKKAAFVRHAAGEIGLGNVRALHGRVQAIAPSERFDVVISRAFSSLGGLIDATRQRLSPRGVWLAMKGRRPDLELAELPAGIDAFHVERVHVPGLDAERCLVWIRPH